MSTATPLALQTAYADLLDRSLATAFDEAFAEDGAFISKTVKSRKYWYFQSTDEDGVRRQRYVGPETPELFQRIETHRQARKDELERRKLVSTLAAVFGNFEPDPVLGDVVQALQRAGVFRLRGVLVGTVAFNCYPAMLGVRLPRSVVRTGDVDIAMDRGIAIAVKDKAAPIIDALKQVDRTFRAVPSRTSPVKSMMFETGGGAVRVDFLTPNKGPDSDEPVRLPSLGLHAQPLRYLGFLIADPVPAVLLHSAGVAVTVPAPERYAIHKLIISRRRVGGTEKSNKDIEQAAALLGVLTEKKPENLRLAWSEAVGSGPKWRMLLGEGVGRLNHKLRDATLKIVDHTRSFVPGLDLDFAAPPMRYDFDRDIVWFMGEAGGAAHRCAVSGEALEDHFGAASSERKDRIEAARGNRAEIERLLKRKYLELPVGDPDETILTTDDVSKLKRARRGT